MGIRIILLISAVFLAAVQAGDNTLTIYNSNISVVNENRSIALVGGEQRIEIAGIPGTIDPTSVILTFPGRSDVTILEYTYTFNLPLSRYLLENSMGQEISIRTINGREYTGVLLQREADFLIFRNREDNLQMIASDQLAEYNFPYPEENPAVEPLLTYRVHAKKRGEITAGLSYIVSGLDWHTEYIMVMDRDESEVNISARASVENNTGKDFSDCIISLIAGDIGEERTSPGRRELVAAAAMDSEHGSGFRQGELSEYYRFQLDRKTTLPHRSIKQIELFTPFDVNITKRYIFENSERSGVSNRNLDTEIEFINPSVPGQAVPLPRGRCRVYMSTGTTAVDLIGESRINHTSAGDTIKIIVGKAFDVKGSRRVVNIDQSTRERVSSSDIGIWLMNRKNEPADVNVIEYLSGNVDIIKSSHLFTRLDANRFSFPVTVPAGEEIQISYRYRKTW